MNADSFENDQVFDDIQTNPEENLTQSSEKNTHTQTTRNLEETYPETITKRTAENPVAHLDNGDKDSDWDRAESYLESNQPIELKIIDQNKGGLLVAFGQLRGFLPNSYIPEIKNISQSKEAFEIKRRMIGTMMQLLIIEVERKRNRLIFSARIGQEEKPKHQLAGLSVGQTLSGRIVNLVKFGAFVDLGRGINGLIHISELSWQRINHPSDLVRIGDEITVIVQEIDHERNRVSLSHKALQPNPWISIEERYKIGDLVEGQITSIQPFGIFLKLAAGVEGLLHQSEFSDNGQIPIQDSAKTDDKLLVRIINIQPEQQRINLSLQQVTMEEQLSWMMYKDQQASEDRGRNDAHKMKTDSNEETP